MPVQRENEEERMCNDEDTGKQVIKDDDNQWEKVNRDADAPDYSPDNG